MSKKNRNKHRAKEFAPLSTESAAAKPAERSASGKDEDLKREFRNLALTIAFILLLLAALYYFDQKDQILEQLANRLFGLFS